MAALTKEKKSLLRRSQQFGPVRACPTPLPGECPTLDHSPKGGSAGTLVTGYLAAPQRGAGKGQARPRMRSLRLAEIYGSGLQALGRQLETTLRFAIAARGIFADPSKCASVACTRHNYRLTRSICAGPRRTQPRCSISGHLVRADAIPARHAELFMSVFAKSSAARRVYSRLAAKAGRDPA